jgi:predicted ferric reductase
MKDVPSYRPKLSMQLLLGLAYVIIIILPLLTAVSSSTWQAQDVLSRSGNGLTLIVFSMLTLQPVLAARLKQLDRQFGLDIVYVFHKTMGMTAGTLQVCALVILAARHGQRLPFFEITATALVIILILSALLYRELRITYERWRRLHNMLFVAALVAVLTQALVISVGIRNMPAVTTVAALFIMAAAAYVFHKFIGPSSRRKALYRVASVTRETKNVWTLTFTPPEGTPRFAYLPGQFQFLTFEGGKGEEHPFTISSSPVRDGRHTATIKESGDFTRTIGRIKAGDLVAVQAPFGRFSHALHPDEHDLVFIAGGIGITPFMSMLRYMRDAAEDKDVLLLYANNTQEDIAFRNELDSLAAKALPRLRVVHVVARAGANWRGEQGFIDRAKIEKFITGDIRSKTFYLCGPPPMMTALIATLIGLGVPSRRIRSERFAL